MLVWRNGNWAHMPHDNFFINMMKGDCAKLKSFQEKRKREIELLAQVATGAVVKANDLYFRYKYETAQVGSPSPSAATQREAA